MNPPVQESAGLAPATAEFPLRTRPEMGRLFTFANVISVGRLLLLIPLFIFLRKGEQESGNFWAMVVMAVALFSDLLDGLIARLLHQESQWGKILDPIADKTWIGCLAIFLAMPWRDHPLPWQFLVLLLVRDAAIVGVAYYVYRKLGVVMKSSWPGKVTMVAEAVTLISYTIYVVDDGVPWFKPEFAVWLTTFLIFYSGGYYAANLHRLLKSETILR